MRRIQYKLALALGLILSLWIQTGFADYLAIKPSSTLPPVIVAGREATFSYAVSNLSSQPLTVHNRSKFSLPVSQVAGPGVGGKSFKLAPHGLTNSAIIQDFSVTPAADETNLNGDILEYIDETKVTQQAEDSPEAQVVAEPTPDMPTLTVDRTWMVLLPGIQEDIDVTNTSATTAANDVKFYMPSELTAKLDSSTKCSVIQPGATCTMSLTANSAATPSTHPHYSVQIQGSNTQSTNITASVEQDLALSTSDVTFSNIGAQNLVLTNNSDPSITIDNISLGSGVNNVNVGSWAHCSAIPGHGGTCDVALTATKDSYGNDQATIQYHLSGGGPRTTTAQVSVNKSAPITFLDDSHTPISEYELHIAKSPQTFYIKNNGNFTWQNPNIDWVGSGITGVIITNNCTSAVDPGNECNFVLTTGSPAKPGYNAQIKATGTNINDTTNNVVVSGGLAIMPEADPAYTHLSYRAVKVENMTGHDANVTSVSVTPTPIVSGKIKYCAPGDSDCVYQTDNNCDDDGGTLPAGDSCRIWFKAERNDAAGLGSLATPAVANVTATVNWPPVISESKSFNISYSQDLYATGMFTSPASGIAKWNGTSWSGLSSGLGGNGWTVLFANGDLYAGGYFNSAGGVSANYIAKWNGTAWSPLGSGMNFGVNALTSIGSDLYAGGGFTSPANRVAKWDGSSWFALGSGVNDNGVNALTSIGNDLYVGGTFINAGGMTANRIAKWDTTTSTWSGVGGGMDRPVDTLISIGSDLYAGGSFTFPASNIAKWDTTASLPTWSALGSGGMNYQVSALATIGSNLYAGGYFSTPASMIAMWNGSSWSALGTGGPNLTVLALTTLGNDVYAGGVFSSPGTRIAKWNGSNWSALGGGVNQQLNGLTTAPSLVITNIP